MPAASIGCERPLASSRAHVRNLFLRVFGVIFLIAFVSLLSQVTLLFGSQGLLPAQRYLAALGGAPRWLDAPTLLWITCSDTALRGAAIAGAFLSCGLIFNCRATACWRCGRCTSRS